MRNTKERLANEERGFANTLGLPLETAFELERPPLLEIEVPPPEEAVAAALRNRLDYAQALHDYRDTLRGVRIARRSLYPDLRLVTRYDRFGELMYGSHASLRDDYEVSCEELDAVVELARVCDGVYGARMTGGGFGGCAIVLADADKADAITERIQSGFADRYARRCPIFPTKAAPGAGRAH